MKTRFFALATLVLALAACNNDNENLNGDPVAAQFTADIALATRASGTTWDNGDRIGITDIGNDTQYGNVPFILKNGKFEAEKKVIYIEDVTRNFAASLFRNIKYFTLRKLYLCRKWMQKRLQKTTTTGITLPNFDFLA